MESQSLRFAHAPATSSGRPLPDGKRPPYIPAGDEARDASGEVHDRMPVILERDVWDEWLWPAKITDSVMMVAMIYPSSQAIATAMTTHLVSRAVNNERTADPADPALIRAI